jgi:hypothetical protein
MQFTALKPGIPKHLPKDKSFLSTVASSKDQTSARRLPDNGAAFRHYEERGDEDPHGEEAPLRRLEP